MSVQDGGFGLGSCLGDACVCACVDKAADSFFEFGGVEVGAMDGEEEEKEGGFSGEDAGGLDDDDDDDDDNDAAARPDAVPTPPDPPDRACAPGRSGTAAGPALAKPKFEKSSGAIRLLFLYRRC